MRIFLFLFITVFQTVITTFAQDTPVSLTLDTSGKVEFLIDKILFGNGVRVGNIKVKGTKAGVGYFQLDTNVIGMKKGILLSTGNVFSSIGPNESTGKSGILDSKSDRSLSSLTKSKTYDVMVLEFDFVPFHNKLSFQYSFGSEEYLEYCGSPYNDVFGFFISGHGYRNKNIALLPDLKTVVSINNVNKKKNKDYYINNDCNVFGPSQSQMFSSHYKNSLIKRSFYLMTFRKLPKYKKFQGKYSFKEYKYSAEERAKISNALFDNFEYDGFTRKMAAECYVIPFKKYHIKIAVGDVGDEIYDSGVFLEEKSFVSYKDSLIPGYKPYKDIRHSLNWDSVFAVPGKISKPVSKQEVYSMVVVYFNSSEFTIPDSSKVKLKKLSEYLVKNPSKRCVITGYTDQSGSKELNSKLSRKRAISVMTFLISNRVDRKKILYAGKDSEDPVSDNETEAGKALNRRVEIMVID